MTLHYLLWAATALIAVLALVGAFLSREARCSRQNGAAHSKDVGPVSQKALIVKSDKSELAKWANLNIYAPDEIQALTPQRAEKYIAELASVAKSMSFDFIVGVHTGGRFISVLVADLINFPRHRLAFAHTERVRKPEIEFSGDTNRLFGKVLVIDDICRTGATLESMRSYFLLKIMDKTYDIESLDFACLVSVRSQVKDKIPFHLNWVAAYTENRNLPFPWAELSAETRCAYSYRQSELDYDEHKIDQHERLTCDYDLALKEAKLHVDIRRIRALLYSRPPVEVDMF